MSKNTVLNTYNFVSTSDRQPQIDSNHYELIIRQQPKQARLCSSKERDRRPVDPPPIIQLKVNGYGDEAQNFLQSPYYFMCANLVHPTDSGESFTISSRYLAGTVVSSLHKLKDIDNKDGGFFVFGDISVRVEGRYRLRFSLFEIIRDEVVHIQSVVSDVFTVYSPKAFPGMSESTFLSRSFSDQGVRIRIRKEHRIQMKRPQSNNRQSDTAEYDDDINVNEEGIMDIPIKRKRSKSQLVPISTFKSNPPLELFDTSSSVPYPQSQQSPYTPLPNSSYQQFHKFPQRQGGGSLSYPPPLGYPPHPPQRQHSYYEDPEYGHSSRDDHTISSPYYYGHEHYEYKRPRLSNSEVSPHDYRQPLTATPLKDNQFTSTSNHHYNVSSSPPLPSLPPPNSSSSPLSSSSYRTSRRLSPLLEHQTSYVTHSTNTSSSHMFNHDPSLPIRHRSFDVLPSSNATSLDSSFHYSATSSATTLQQPPHPIPPSESFYRSSSSSSSSTQLFTPKPPVRSRTLPPFMNHHNGISNINNNDNNNDRLHHHNHHHHDSTSSNQLPTPKTSIDVDGLHGLHNHNKKQLYPPYPSYPPLTPPNPNSSSVDSYKNGNNNGNNNNNLTPSFTQHFTSSPRPGPLQLPPKSPLSSNTNDNSIMRTSSLPIMTSNSNTNSSNTTTFLNNGGVLTSSPLLLPANNNNLPRLPPITALTGNIDFTIKKKDNYYNEQQQEPAYYQPHSMNDTYNNSNIWHNNGGSVDNGY